MGNRPDREDSPSSNDNDYMDYDDDDDDDDIKALWTTIGSGWGFRNNHHASTTISSLGVLVLCCSALVLVALGVGAGFVLGKRFRDRHGRGRWLYSDTSDDDDDDDDDSTVATVQNERDNKGDPNENNDFDVEENDPFTNCDCTCRRVVWDDATVATAQDEQETETETGHSFPSATDCAPVCAPLVVSLATDPQEAEDPSALSATTTEHSNAGLPEAESTANKIDRLVPSGDNDTTQ